MQSIDDLTDLLMQHIQNLYAAEEQIKQAMPAIIEKVHHSSLKNALTHHLGLTEGQKNRLEEISGLLHEKKKLATEQTGASSTSFTNKGVAGLIEEANELLENKLAEEVIDAAIISCVQKLEHYEITTYGTALAYAKQLHLRTIEALLDETLTEEYDADDLLTSLATAAINKQAIHEDFQEENSSVPPDDSASEETTSRPAKVRISERTVNSPGGRAGTSHRGYGSGESRGH